MWHCPVAFMTRFQQTTLYLICFSLGRLIRLSAGPRGGVCKHLLSACFSVVPPTFLSTSFPLLIGTVLAASCRWNVVLGGVPGGWPWSSLWQL